MDLLSQLMLTVMIGLHVAQHGYFRLGLSLISEERSVSLTSRLLQIANLFKPSVGVHKMNLNICQDNIITRLNTWFSTSVIHKVAGLHIGISTIKCTRWQHHIVTVPSTCSVFLPFLGRFVTLHHSCRMEGDGGLEPSFGLEAAPRLFCVFLYGLVSFI